MSKNIVGIDISEGMMRIGMLKVKKAGLENVISFERKIVNTYHSTITVSMP